MSTKRTDIPTDKNKWGVKGGQGSYNILLLAYALLLSVPNVISPTRFVTETIMLYSRPC